MTEKLSTRDVAGISECIRARSSFTTHGALQGMEFGDGKMIIFSYDQSIAVVDYAAKEYALNPQKYSVTTSRHQGTTRRALAYALPDFTEVERPAVSWSV